MKIVSTNVFVGPNVWARFPVIRHVVDLGVLEEWPSARIGSAFIDGLVAALPGLAEHGCSYREPGGFIRRLREDEGTWMGHIMEHCALEIQGVAGTEVTLAGPVARASRGSTTWSTSTASAMLAWRPGSWRCGC